MALSDIFPVIIVAVALWILVYCILMTQKCFMETQYQEIAPKPEEEPQNPSPNQQDQHVHHTKQEEERHFLAYYL
ncbi:unnamed protein product [Caenorhabditis angaria]|uniref:Uncharacterized protein n=1 Tax=Caenorhabditis angaria TaxID=860376 RepID=A0A9P1ITL1_9PELO|nr:unnamed protein product [Caenorhabditis angaria]